MSVNICSVVHEGTLCDALCLDSFHLSFLLCVYKVQRTFSSSSGCHWSQNLQWVLKNFWVARASCLILSTEFFSMVCFQDFSKPKKLPMYNPTILSHIIFSFSRNVFNSLLDFLQLNKVTLSNLFKIFLTIIGNLLQTTSMIETKMDTEISKMLD